MSLITWHLFANQKSGGFKARRINELTTRMQERGQRVEAHLPASLKALREEIAELAEAGERHFIIAAGDGTLSQAVNCLVDLGVSADSVVALYPMGSGNDTARSLDMRGRRKRLVDQWVQALVARRWQPIDLIKIQTEHESRVSVNLWGVGLDAQVLAARTSGSYLTGLLKALFAGRFVKGGLKLDALHEGLVEITGEWVTLMGANGRYAGGGMRFVDDARINEDNHYLFLLEKTWLLSLLPWVPLLYTGGIDRHKKVTINKVDSFELNLEAESVWQIDGEVMQPAKHFNSSTMSKAIQLLYLAEK